jgi:hypothetical protein
LAGDGQQVVHRLLITSVFKSSQMIDGALVPDPVE